MIPSGTPYEPSDGTAIDTISPCDPALEAFVTMQLRHQIVVLRTEFEDLFI
jgi:hypothetical protein